MHLRLNHENVLTFILLQNNKTIKNFYLISCYSKETEQVIKYIKTNKIQIEAQLSAEIIGHYIYTISFEMLKILIKEFPIKKDLVILYAFKYIKAYNELDLETVQNLAAIDAEVFAKSDIFCQQYKEFINCFNKYEPLQKTLKDLIKSYEISNKTHEINIYLQKNINK